ncbi:MAG TPA: hypothetical protein VNA17_11700 [Pyrinomonadaceae bacterium]|nr:hypothetical protein [Pyrinomonadaceae bacterium]
MRIGKLTSQALAILLLCSVVFTQTPTTESDAEKEKKKKETAERVVKLLDDAIAEGGSLRLPQNRAVVMAIAGDLYWKYDSKRSRGLFRSAAEEILVFNQEAEKERRESPDAYAGVFDYSTDVRFEILPLVAKHDAELAFDLLMLTRSARIAEAIAKMALPNAKSPGDGMFSFNPDRQRVASELALEQRFALLAADENPEKAIKMIKESLAKGISTNVLALLQKLNKKDEKKATELAGDVIKKLVDSDLARDEEVLRTAMSFLQFAFKPPKGKDAKEKQFTFSESLVKDLAAKMASTFLQGPKTMTMAMMLDQAMPVLEKFAPDKLPFLRQRQAELEAGMPPEFKRMQEQQKLWNPNSTPEEILAQLPKLQNEYEKVSAHESLIRKIGEIEDDARARKLIDQIQDEKTRTRAQDTYEAARIGRTASAGKLEDAKKLIGNLTKKKMQIERLVALATDFHKKGGEKEIAMAKGLMKDAKALTNENAETAEDWIDVMEVVKGYALIEPDTAFRMFEPFVDMVNEYIHANSVLSKYNARSSTFRKGELAIKVSGNPYDQIPLFRFMPQMHLLGKADLERMNTVADRFNRADSRSMVKLYVLQGFLKDDSKPDETVHGGMMIINY